MTLLLCFFFFFFFFWTIQQVVPVNFDNGFWSYFQAYVKWNCILIHQWIKNKRTILKLSDRDLWNGHLFFSWTLTWSLEDACSLFCPEHFIFKLSSIHLDQKRCLFLLPSANKFIIRALFTQLLLSAFLSKRFVFRRTEFSCSPTHSVRGMCGACRACWMCMLHIMANTELMVINHSIVL